MMATFNFLSALPNARLSNDDNRVTAPADTVYWRNFFLDISVMIVGFNRYKNQPKEIEGVFPGVWMRADPLLIRLKQYCYLPNSSMCAAQGPNKITKGLPTPGKRFGSNGASRKVAKSWHLCVKPS